MRIGSISIRRLDSSLIESLLNPEAYSHPVESIELIETHISWVILTGPYVYKIKKPIRLGFLDFRKLEQRLFYCEEEVRLNRPWAPQIYLGVVPISMRQGTAVVGGDGEPIEYAVRMRQFDKTKSLDAELAAGRLSGEDMDELAEKIARQHQSAQVMDPGNRDGKLAHIKKDMWDNLEALDGVLDPELLQTLRQWTGRELDRLDPLLRQRIDDGFVRECHGDLHLSNLVRLPSGITAFDCIEFSDELRIIDVMCDLAFLVMDLVSRRRTDLAYRFLNRYLEVTGDYRSMELCTLYFVYRCLVRAKVAAIRSREREDDSFAADDLMRMRTYCDIALERCRQRVPCLVVLHGLSGSGKTWVSGKLVPSLPAVRIRSDIERKRLFGLDETADSGSGVAQGIYTESAGERVYSLLHRLASWILAAGHDVILDASYLKRRERQHAREIAIANNAGFVIIDVCAPTDILRDRIVKRADNASEASEADLAVLAHQLENMDPLDTVEEQATVHWDSSAGKPIEDLLQALAERRESDRSESRLISVI